MNRILYLLLFFGTLFRAASQTMPPNSNTPSPAPEPRQLDAALFHQLRGGLQNSHIRFEREKKGRVAFLGGSITYNPGWRDEVMAYLQERFPHTRFEFISAGIPSMGSTPGAFRIGDDVLAKGRVDLLFEEAAVNDKYNGRTSVEQIRGMEGIVRRARGANPAMDIVLMYFADPYKMETYRAGKTPEVIRHHDKVAEHYRLPAINLALEVTQRIDSGEFTWENDFIDLHPSPFGQKIYARSIKVLLQRAWSGALAKADTVHRVTPHPMPPPLDPHSYDRGGYVGIESLKLKKGWRIDPDWQPPQGQKTREGYVNVPMLIGQPPHRILKFTFEGSTVGINVAAGPDAGKLAYSVDGGAYKTVDLFTPWSQNLHLPWHHTLAVGLKPGRHVLRLKVSDTKNEASKGYVCRIKNFYVNR